MKDCTECIHNECCVYLWKFKFNNTDSVKILRKDPYTKKSCGHHIKDKTEQILQEQGKQPKRIEIMLNLSKIWRWFKRKGDKSVK